MRIKVVNGICEVYMSSESTTPEEQTEAKYAELE